MMGIREKLRRAKAAIKSRFKRPDLYDMKRFERVGVCLTAPSEMSVPERLMLYSMVRGTRPERVLEIGSRHGGSASIIAAAMEDVGHGRIIGIDPAPKLKVPMWKFYGRFELIEQPSPDAIPVARSRGGGAYLILP